MSNLRSLNFKKTVIFMCDLQEKFKNHISSFDLIIKTANRMIAASKLLSIPLVVTEQYPQGLGKTVPELDISRAQIIEDKVEFSMLTNKIVSYLEENTIESVIIFGIEAHVCVYQTCLELLSKGIVVHLLVDGISSRNVNDALVSTKQLQSMGVVLSTSESILFQLIKNKNHEKFKEIQNLVRDIIPATELLKRF